MKLYHVLKSCIYLRKFRIENSFYSVEEYLDRNNKYDLGYPDNYSFVFYLHALVSYIYFNCYLFYVKTILCKYQCNLLTISVSSDDVPEWINEC
jgi:hypothetical protein